MAWIWREEGGKVEVEERVGSFGRRAFWEIEEEALRKGEGWGLREERLRRGEVRNMVRVKIMEV